MVKTRTGGGRDDGPFSGMSKQDVANRRLSLSEREWLGQTIHTKARTVQELHKWLGIPERSLQRFAKKAKEAAAFKPRGRPPMLDGPALVDLERFVTLGRKGEKAKSQASFAKKVQVLACETRKRAGNHCPAPNPSAKYVEKIKTCLSSRVNTTQCSQQKTAPRKRADLDTRGMFVHAAALQAMMENVERGQIFNFDGVSYVLDPASGKYVYIKDKAFEGPIERDDNAPKLLAQGLKVMNVVAASGHLGPQVYLYADDSIPEDEFAPLQSLEGFGPGVDVSAKTFFTASKTRNGTPKMYAAIFEEALIPWVMQMRKVTLDETETEAAPALLIMDGEKTPIDGLLLVPDLQTMPLQVLKAPPSWSHCSNALDAGFVHSSTKKLLLNLDTESALAANTANQRRLDIMFKNMLPGQSKAKRDTMVDNTIRVNATYQALPLKKMIQESFSKSGLIGPGTDDILAAQLGLGTAQISKEDMASMRRAWRPCVDLFRRHGQLTEEMLDEAGVPQPVFPEHLIDTRRTLHHQRPIEHQRSTNLTHDETGARAGMRYQLQLCRKDRQEQKKKALKEKKDWLQQTNDPNSEFNIALQEFQEEFMDEAFEKDAHYTLQSERLLVLLHQTQALADWEASKSTAQRPVNSKRQAADKENRVNNSTTNPYAKRFNENKTRNGGITKARRI